MNQQHSTFPVNLFYSYSHSDQMHRESMERALTLLTRNNLVKSWSDQSILPGQQISTKIREKMDKADIMVFLVSQKFIASDECMKEWGHAKMLSRQGKFLFRVPVILSPCAWHDLLGKDDIKALPNDGKPVSEFDDSNIAWMQVYEGIKSVIDELKNTFSPKTNFLKEMEQTEFLSQQHIRLQDIYVFLPLSCGASQSHDDQTLGTQITNEEQLLDEKFVLIHGEEQSGKTALGRHMFLSLIKKQFPVLYIDLEKVSGKPKENLFIENYRKQFNGDYSLWSKQISEKTLILDNLSSNPTLVDFVVFAKNYFDRIIVTLPSDVYNSFFIDEVRFVDFIEMKIQYMTHRQQETLIRKRWGLLSNLDKPVLDGLVDQIENRVNSIMTNKIVPRYPFYVLSILQTYEGFMPSNLSITSYGHCYQVLIIATLRKAGISEHDNEINACFNFAEHLAFEIYQHAEKHTKSVLDFDEFVKQYKRKFVIHKSTLNRIKDHRYGLISKEGHFKATYMHYFFLGKYLSKNRQEHQEMIEQICEKSYLDSNYLTLLFIIHHTNDDKIIDDILLRTMCTLEAVSPATLDRAETKRFGDIIRALPETVLSSDSVEEERGKERDARDIGEKTVETENGIEQTEIENPVNACYRILKNNRVLGQVLRNQYGSLKKEKVAEIVETIADGGLRLVNICLKDESEITDLARYIHKKHPDYDMDEIRRYLQFFSFVWTMLNVGTVVRSVNSPEIREVVDAVVSRRSSPAYDLIGYFSQLAGAKELTTSLKEQLEGLLKKHRDPFLTKILSLATQQYMNTHRSSAKIEQTVCSLLQIQYVPRITMSK